MMLSFLDSTTWTFKMALIGLVLMMSSVACSGSDETAGVPDRAEETLPADTTGLVSPGVPDPAHNAQNSLDYHGTYEGVLPCASCEGIETRLSLYPGQQYRLETVYKGRSEEAFVDEGRFSWNEAGSTITLEGIDADERTNQYFVAENRLIKLDFEGDRITGELAEAYELDKKSDVNLSTNASLPHEQRFVPTALNGQEIQLPEEAERQPDLYFNTEENRLYGSAGCNRYRAGYEAPGDGELKLSPIAATKMMCDHMALEDRYLQVLQLVKAYDYDPQIQQLILLDEEGIIIARFRHENGL
jgi:heat shock protein HslJ